MLVEDGLSYYFKFFFVTAAFFSKCVASEPILAGGAIALSVTLSGGVLFAS